MVGVSVLKFNPTPLVKENLSLLEDKRRQEKIISALDKINDQYGEFHFLQRGVFLLQSAKLQENQTHFKQIMDLGDLKQKGNYPMVFVFHLMPNS